MAPVSTIQDLRDERDAAVAVFDREIADGDAKLAILDSQIDNIETKVVNLAGAGVKTKKLRAAPDSLKQTRAMLKIRVQLLGAQSASVMLETAIKITESDEIQTALAKLNGIAVQMNTVAARMVTVTGYINNSQELGNMAVKINSALMKK